MTISRTAENGVIVTFDKLRASDAIVHAVCGMKAGLSTLFPLLNKKCGTGDFYPLPSHSSLAPISVPTPKKASLTNTTDIPGMTSVVKPWDSCGPLVHSSTIIFPVVNLRDEVVCVTWVVLGRDHKISKTAYLE